VTTRRLLRVFGPTALAATVAAALLSTGTASAAPDTGTLLAAPADRAIAGSYIVVLKDSATLRSRDTVAKTARELSTRHGGKVGHTYSSSVRGFSAKISEAKARELAADPRVAYVQQDGKVHASATQNNATWGIDRIDQRALPLSTTYTYATTASNVSAYIIDTGVRASHSQFGGRAKSGYDFVDNDANSDDGNGHGTHVAGTIGGSTYGVAKGVTIYGVRVLDDEGSGTDAGVIAGIDWVTAHAVKPAVANMSLGGDASTALDDAVKRSIAAGITYGLAAGNETANACTGSPSRVPEGITVGATTSTDARASYSNYGTCLDIFAPGSSITSSWNTSDSATNTISGTSMATPHVVGAAALYLAANPSATPAQVRDALVNNATTGVVTSPGTGSPNRLLYTGTGTTPTPTPTPTPGGKYFENGTDLSIPDAGTAVTSSITVSGVTGNAPSTLKVGLDIQHTYRGDLVIDLLAPDGTAYRLKNSASTDSADNVVTTYTTNASSEVANGVWKLRVRDVYADDTGYLNKWSLQF
jgi:subtilisin family serine protease